MHNRTEHNEENLNEKLLRMGLWRRLGSRPIERAAVSLRALGFSWGGIATLLADLGLSYTRQGIRHIVLTRSLLDGDPYGIHDPKSVLQRSSEDLGKDGALASRIVFAAMVGAWPEKQPDFVKIYPNRLKLCAVFVEDGDALAGWKAAGMSNKELVWSFRRTFGEISDHYIKKVMPQICRKADVPVVHAIASLMEVLREKMN